MINFGDITPGRYVVAPSFLEDEDATDTRGMKVLKTFEHNGRPAFEARLNVRSGDPVIPMSERHVWRYCSQVTRIVR
jgi:hypothetical protein